MTVRSSWDAASLGLVRVNQRRLRSMAAVPNPIAKARLFEAALGRAGERSYADVAAKFGVTRQEVCQYLAVVRRLPANIIRAVEAETDPARLRRLSLRKLLSASRHTRSHERRRALREIAASVGHDVAR